jgi:hypothetical protein
MKRMMTVLAVGLALQTAPAWAQAGGGRAEDVKTLDGILEAYYEVVSRPAGVAADRQRDEWIHHPDALVAITGVDADGSPYILTMTLAEYHERYGAATESAFYEWEVHREVHRFGNVAHVWSTYASSLEPRGEVSGRGINSIQLYHDGTRWWILSWVFDTERAGNPIPAQ